MGRELDAWRRSIEPRKDGGVTEPPFHSPHPQGMFTSRYSRTEITSQADGIHLKRQETHYANGRLVSEECEGMMDRAAYDDMVRQTQADFLRRVAGFLKLFY